MRILQIISNWFDSGARGGQLYTYHLCAELAQRHTVGAMFARFDGTQGLQIGRYGDIHSFSIGRVYDQGLQSTVMAYSDPEANAAFEHVLDEFRPDILHCQHLAQLSIDFPAIAKRRGIPVVYTLHDFWLMCPQFVLLDYQSNLCRTIDRRKCVACCLAQGGRPMPKTDVLRWIPWTIKRRATLSYRLRIDRPRTVGAIYRDVDLFLSPSISLRDLFVREGLPASRIELFDLPVAPRARVRRPRPVHRRLTFGFVGSVSRFKGMDLLLEAFASITDADLRIHGEAASHYIERAAGLPHIVFKGEFLPADSEEIFGGLDVLVVPAIAAHPTPCVIQEAFRYGVPAIASDLGGMEDLVTDGHNGLHFRRGDADDLRTKIRHFIDRPDEVTRMAANAPAIPTVDAHAREIEAWYERLAC